METYFGSITSHPPTQKKQIGRNKVGVLEAMEWNSFHSSLTIQTMEHIKIPFHPTPFLQFPHIQSHFSVNSLGAKR